MQTKANLQDIFLLQAKRDKLPVTMFLMNGFQLRGVITGFDQFVIVLHADGHGTPEQKFETWNVMRQAIQPEIFMAWKNFIDEDQPMFTPEQTMDIEPRPWIVTYQ